MLRSCLQCRCKFEPEHRGLFRCNNCKVNQAKQEEEDEKYTGNRYADRTRSGIAAA